MRRNLTYDSACVLTRALRIKLQEFEQQMREMKSQFEEMRLSKERLQEEMGRLRGHYEQQVASVVSQGNNTARGHHHSNEEEDEETEERDDRTAGDYYDDGTFVAADAPRTDKHNGKAKQSSATKKLGKFAFAFCLLVSKFNKIARDVLKVAIESQDINT